MDEDTIRARYSFAAELDKALAAGLIRNDFQYIAKEAIWAYEFSKGEADITSAAEKASTNVTGAKRHKHLAKLIDRLAFHLRDDIEELDPLFDRVDHLGEMEHLYAISGALKSRNEALKSVEALRMLVDEPRLVEQKNNAAWHEQYFFRQIVTVWHDNGGCANEDGFNALCDIATALWRDMGGSIPNWQTDNPDRTWARRRVKRYWNSVRPIWNIYT
jgi:hypothetical protein